MPEKGLHRLTFITDWFPRDQRALQMIFRYNSVVAYTLRGEYERAKEELHQLWTLRDAELEVPAAVIMIACYIQLMTG